MMRPRRLAISLLFGEAPRAARLACLLVGLAAGCGGTVSDGGASAATVPIDQFPARFADAWCDNVASCCSAAQWNFDLSSCKRAAALTLGTAIVASAVDNPNIEYDPNAAASCLAAIASATRGCEVDGANTALAASCSEMLLGKLAPGAVCKSDQECAPVSGEAVHCSGLMDSDGVISGSGVCVALAPPQHGKTGDSCLDTCYQASCITGDSANSSLLPCFVSDGLACHAPDLTCQPLAKLGESCSTGECVSGAFCDSGVCAAQRDSGPCNVGDDTCARNSFCNETGQCELKHPTGSSCTADEACQINHCVLPGGGTGLGTCSPNSLANDKACSGDLE